MIRLFLFFSFSLSAQVPDFLYNPLDFHQVYWGDTNNKIEEFYRQGDMLIINDECTLFDSKENGRATVCVSESSNSYKLHFQGRKSITVIMDFESQQPVVIDKERIRNFNFPSLRRLNFDSYRLFIPEVGMSFSYQRTVNGFIANQFYNNELYKGSLRVEEVRQEGRIVRTYSFRNSQQVIEFIQLEAIEDNGIWHYHYKISGTNGPVSPRRVTDSINGLLRLYTGSKKRLMYFLKFD